MKSHITILMILTTTACIAGPVKTPSPVKSSVIAAANLKKAEEEGAVLSQAQINALVDQGKVKEAMKAFFAREAKKEKRK